MGRSKQSRPIKRRRVILEADDSVVAEEQTTLSEQQQQQEDAFGAEEEEEEELAKAIELLRNTPPDQVEAAAAEATRLDLARNDRWIHLRCLPNISSSPTTTMATTTATVTMFDDKDSNDRDDDKIEKLKNATITFNNLTTAISNSTSASASASATATADIATIEDATTATKTSTTTPEFTSSIPSWLRGLGFARLATDDFVALQKLHQVIKDCVNNEKKSNINSSNDNASSSTSLEWASWSGSIEDPRKRAFGFLPGTWVSIADFGEFFLIAACLCSIG